MEFCGHPEVYETQNYDEETGEEPSNADGSDEEQIEDGDTRNVDNDNDEDSEKTDLYQQQLRDRIITLRTALYDLKKEIKEERECFRKESLAQEPVPEPSTYPQSINYDDLSLFHQESKAHLQRQLAISNYRRRLLEVENMCNMELIRVKQNVQFLQPLQMMVSEWNMDGDGDHLAVGKAESVSSSSEGDFKVSKGESSIQLESISSKLYNEMNDMFNSLSTRCQETIPNWNLEASLSQSSDVFSENEM